MTGLAVVISYGYEFLALPLHAYQLYQLRQQARHEAYSFLQHTFSELEAVRLTYLKLKQAEDQLVNSQLSLGITQRAHADVLREAIARILQRDHERTPNAA